MRNISPQQRTVLKKIGIAFLSLACVAALAWLIVDANQLYKAGDLTTTLHYRHEQAPPGNAAITAPVTVTIATIQPWMTFDYLNVVFKLRPAYLKEALAVTDTRYPNIRIDSYVRHNKLDSKAFLQSIKRAITNYSYTK